ncbi:hypothetical protein U1Q18_035514 [Sarracenia purpurea var. burkii]
MSGGLANGARSDWSLAARRAASIGTATAKDERPGVDWWRAAARQPRFREGPRTTSTSGRPEATAISEGDTVNRFRISDFKSSRRTAEVNWA